MKLTLFLANLIPPLFINNLFIPTSLQHLIPPLFINNLFIPTSLQLLKENLKQNLIKSINLRKYINQEFLNFIFLINKIFFINLKQK